MGASGRRTAVVVRIFLHINLASPSAPREIPASPAMAEVYHGVRYVDGRRGSGENTRRVAA